MQLGHTAKGPHQSTRCFMFHDFDVNRRPCVKVVLVAEQSLCIPCNPLQLCDGYAESGIQELQVECQGKEYGMYTDCQHPFLTRCFVVLHDVREDVSLHQISVWHPQCDVTFCLWCVTASGPCVSGPLSVSSKLVSSEWSRFHVVCAHQC